MPIAGDMGYQGTTVAVNGHEDVGHMKQKIYGAQDKKRNVVRRGKKITSPVRNTGLCPIGTRTRKINDVTAKRVFRRQKTATQVETDDTEDIILVK